METKVDFKEQIKTFEDALTMAGETAESFTARTALDTPDEVAYKKIKVIAKALNGGWKPNWGNSNEIKYYPWFDMSEDNGSGLGLSFSVCDYDYSFSGVGSRLVFKTRELAEYAGEHFVEIYAALMVIPAEEK